MSNETESVEGSGAAAPNETACTPGPWQRNGVRRKLGNEDCIAVGPDGFTIAFLPIGRRPHEQAGAIADANLIAAAPDLLQFAKLVLRGLERGNVKSRAVINFDPNAASVAMESLEDIARAAIGKALGR